MKYSDVVDFPQLFRLVIAPSSTGKETDEDDDEFTMPRLVASKEDSEDISASVTVISSGAGVLFGQARQQLEPFSDEGDSDSSEWERLSCSSTSVMDDDEDEEDQIWGSNNDNDLSVHDPDSEGPVVDISVMERPSFSSAPVIDDDGQVCGPNNDLCSNNPCNKESVVDSNASERFSFSSAPVMDDDETVCRSNTDLCSNNPDINELAVCGFGDAVEDPDLEDPEQTAFVACKGKLLFPSNPDLETSENMPPFVDCEGKSILVGEPDLEASEKMPFFANEEKPLVAGDDTDWEDFDQTPFVACEGKFDPDWEDIEQPPSDACKRKLFAVGDPDWEATEQANYVVCKCTSLSTRRQLSLAFLLSGVVAVLVSVWSSQYLDNRNVSRLKEILQTFQTAQLPKLLASPKSGHPFKRLLFLSPATASLVSYASENDSQRPNLVQKETEGAANNSIVMVPKQLAFHSLLSEDHEEKEAASPTDVAESGKVATFQPELTKTETKTEIDPATTILEPEQLPPLYPVQPSASNASESDQANDHKSLIGMVVKDAPRLEKEQMLRPVLRQLKRAMGQALKENSVHRLYTSFQQRQSEPRYVRFQD